MSIKERVLEFISNRNIPVSEFERRCSLSNGYVSSMRKGFGTGKLDNVLNEFTELDRDWLLYGEGEMLRDNIPKAEKEPTADISVPASVWQVIQNQAESLKMKDAQTSELIELLKEQLKKGQDVENLFRAASSVVEEDE